jgi:hypothetical protein
MDPSLAAPEASGRRAGLLHTVAALVFAYLPLSVQAITLPALSKAWKRWAEEQRAKERALEAAERFWRFITNDAIKAFYVPLWAARHHPRPLSNKQKRRFQLRAVAHGDVGAADWFGIDVSDKRHGLQLCTAAAYYGQLEALQWLRSRGCYWNARTCSSAAGGGHLAVLQWARANGCDWDADTLAAAEEGGHLDVLQWVVASGDFEYHEDEYEADYHEGWEDDESDEQD